VALQHRPLALAQMGKTLDLTLLRGKGRDEARQDLIAAELEVRVCALVIFGAGGLEPGIDRTRQDDRSDLPMAYSPEPWPQNSLALPCAPYKHYLCFNSSGSLAMLAEMRRASLLYKFTASRRAFHATCRS
jgi:hypothetical protein